ncbi:hypothetical protein VPH35_103190 [Triticum aestivum]
MAPPLALHLDIAYACPRLLASVLRSASTTILAAKINDCAFPDLKIVLAMNFPNLKKLTLFDTSISEDVFHTLPSMLHGYLDILYMAEVCAAGRLRVSSPTLKTIIFSHSSSEIILGPFIAAASNILLFQVAGISSVSSANSMRTVKVLALSSSADKLHAVLNILRWFPCLERPHLTFRKHHDRDQKNEPQHDPLHPIEFDFARFIVLNAKVLEKIEFEAHNHYGTEMVGYEHKLLQVENRASRHARFVFKTY